MRVWIDQMYPAARHVQGPPGTGKTRTLLAMIRIMCAVAAQRGRDSLSEFGPILATAGTNAAADNLLEGLVRSGTRPALALAVACALVLGSKSSRGKAQHVVQGAHESETHSAHDSCPKAVRGGLFGCNAGTRS